MSDLRGRTAAVGLCLGLVAAVLVSPGSVVAGDGHPANGGSPVDVDIDSDGRGDLLIGSGPGGGGAAIQVQYGDGVRQRITAGSLRPRLDYRGFGSHMAACDVNGDGFSDAVVGAPFATVGRSRSAGRVVVLYGAASGLSPRRLSVLSQSTPGVPGRSESDDLFGAAIGCGRTGPDRFDDIVIGVPDESWRARPQAGRVVVVPGGVAGVVPALAWSFSEDTQGVPGRAERGDFFGSQLVVDDVTGDGLDELIVWSFEDFAGGLFVLSGQRARLRAGDNSVIYGGTRGLPTIDGLMVTGNFNGRGPNDLVFSSFRQVGSGDHVGIDGQVTMLPGTPSGLSTIGRRTITRETLGMPVLSRLNGLGLALAAGDVEGDGDDDLLVYGSGFDDSGRVFVFRGGPEGISTNGLQLFSQRSPDIPGEPHRAGRFGRCLELVDLDGDGRSEAAITSDEQIKFVNGVPESSVGAVTILPATPSGLTAQGATRLDPPDFGANTRNEGAGFGWELAG